MPTISCPGTSGSRAAADLAVDHVEVGAADAAGAHADQELAGPGSGTGQLRGPERAPGSSSTIARIARERYEIVAASSTTPAPMPVVLNPSRRSTTRAARLEANVEAVSRAIPLASARATS